MKKKPDLSALRNRISHKNRDKFSRADEILGTQEPLHREKVIRRSYALLKQDLDAITLLTDRCLSKKVKTSDSHLIRLGLLLATELSADELVQKITQIPTVKTGRPTKI